MERPPTLKPPPASIAPPHCATAIDKPNASTHTDVIGVRDAELPIGSIANIGAIALIAGAHFALTWSIFAIAHNATGLDVLANIVLATLGTIMIAGGVIYALRTAALGFVRNSVRGHTNSTSLEPILGLIRRATGLFGSSALSGGGGVLRVIATEFERRTRGGGPRVLRLASDLSRLPALKPSFEETFEPRPLNGIYEFGTDPRNSAGAPGDVAQALYRWLLWAIGHRPWHPWYVRFIRIAALYVVVLVLPEGLRLALRGHVSFSLVIALGAFVLLAGAPVLARMRRGDIFAVPSGVILINRSHPGSRHLAELFTREDAVLVYWQDRSVLVLCGCDGRIVTRTIPPDEAGVLWQAWRSPAPPPAKGVAEAFADTLC